MYNICMSDTRQEICDERPIFERVRSLGLPLGRYAVVGGSMEAHGLRRARDIDIDIVANSELFRTLES